MQRMPDVPLNQFTVPRSLFGPVHGIDLRSRGSFVDGSFVDGSFAQTRLPSQSRAGHNTTTLEQVV